MYAFALSATGFDVVVAQDSGEACRRAWELHPDIIVADLPMPTSNGWQFLEDLKQNPQTRDIPVVAMSGYVQLAVEGTAEQNGFAAFFLKPCLPDELAVGIRQVLDRYAHVDIRH